jgi:outer membrane biosynthesis protein TonB
LVGLLLTCPLLALILWQWQQLTQALGLLRTSPEVLAGVTPLTASQLESQRLNLGLPLLLLTPLQIPEPAAVQPEPEPETVPVAEPEPLPEPEPDPELENASISSQDPEPAEEPAAELEEEWEKELEEKPALIEASLVTRTSLDTEASVADPVAIQPEETAEQPESTELDQEIP